MLLAPPSVSVRLVRLTATDGVGTMFTASVVSAPASVCAESATVTDSVRTVSKPPEWPSVSVADVSPAFTVASEATRSLGRFVVSAKLAAVAPTSNAALVSVTVTVAPFKVASASAAGAVIAADGTTTATVNVSVSWSVLSSFESESETVIVTVAGVVVAVGVPHTVRGALPAQLPVPSASNTRPVGSPLSA